MTSRAIISLVGLLVFSQALAIEPFSLEWERVDLRADGGERLGLINVVARIARDETLFLVVSSKLGQEVVAEELAADITNPILRTLSVDVLGNYEEHDEPFFTVCLYFGEVEYGDLCPGEKACFGYYADAVEYSFSIHGVSKRISRNRESVETKGYQLGHSNCAPRDLRR